MKNLAFLLFATLLLAHTASSQTTFSITPNPALGTGGPEDFDVAAHAVIKNISNVRDSISWERNVINLPEGFNTAVCDPIQCYFPNVNTKTFGLAPGASGAMDLHFYNNLETTGSGLIHLKVVNVNVPTDEVTAVYIYNSTSSTKDPLPKANVHLFPNPTTEGFTLENANEVAAVSVFSLDGRQVARFLQPTPDQRYSVADQPAGTYIVALLAKNGKVFQAVELRKQ